MRIKIYSPKAPYKTKMDSDYFQAKTKETNVYNNTLMNSSEIQ